MSEISREWFRSQLSRASGRPYRVTHSWVSHNNITHEHISKEVKSPFGNPQSSETDGACVSTGPMGLHGVRTVGSVACNIQPCLRTVGVVGVVGACIERKVDVFAGSGEIPSPLMMYPNNLSDGSENLHFDSLTTSPWSFKV